MLTYRRDVPLARRHGNQRVIAYLPKARPYKYQMCLDVRLFPFLQIDFAGEAQASVGEHRGYVARGLGAVTREVGQD